MKLPRLLFNLIGLCTSLIGLGFIMWCFLGGEARMLQYVRLVAYITTFALVWFMVAVFFVNKDIKIGGKENEKSKSKTSR